MTVVFAERGLTGSVGEFHALQARWLPAVLGYGAVATNAVGFGVRVWLGHGYGTASVMAVVLMAGYTVHVAVTGIRTCFVRAVGTPGLETRYSLVAMALNLALTIPFAVLFGAVGAVAATAAGIAAGSLYFVRLYGRVAHLHDQVPSQRWLLATALAVALTVVGELLVEYSDWHGVLPLLLAGVPALVGLTVVAAQMISWSGHRPASAPDLYRMPGLGQPQPQADELFRGAGIRGDQGLDHPTGEAVSGDIDAA